MIGYVNSSADALTLAAARPSPASGRGTGDNGQRAGLRRELKLKPNVMDTCWSTCVLRASQSLFRFGRGTRGSEGESLRVNEPALGVYQEAALALQKVL